MDTIKNYLDNLFASLPKTAKLQELKLNILSNMEEKYHELKYQGKTENEAIGIVISEFGNIDELINELGIQTEEPSASQPAVTEEEVDSYLRVKRNMGVQVGIGVLLCILSPIAIILTGGLTEAGIIFRNLSENAADLPGLIVLLLFVAIAVGIFIYSGMNFEQYKYMEEGVSLSLDMEAKLKQGHKSFIPKFTLCMIVGVCMCILSPLGLFIADANSSDLGELYGTVFLLAIVSVAVFLFISAGMIKSSYEILLKLGDHSPKKKEDKAIGAVAAIVWPLATAVFLFYGFVYGLWYISWIVFPIVGILFGMFAAVYSILTEKNK